MEAITRVSAATESGLGMSSLTLRLTTKSGAQLPLLELRQGCCGLAVSRRFGYKDSLSISFLEFVYSE